MRASLLLTAALAAALTGCTDACKNGTALLNIQFDATTANADQLEVSISVDDGAPITTNASKQDNASSGTLQIEFPSGYPAGHMLKVTVTAERAGQVLGSTSTSFALESGCTAFGLTLGAGGAPPDLSMNNLPVVSITSTPDLVGFVTKLDGSGSSDPLGMSLTYAWSFTQVPTGSTVTVASLTSMTANKTSFEPDFGGDYQVTLTATTPDQRIGMNTVTVTVPTVPLFHYRMDSTATTSSIGAAVVRSDGTGAHAVSCPFSEDGGLNVGNQPHQLGFGASAWEPPTLPGASRFAFLFPTSLDGTTAPELHVADEHSDCANAPPPRVDANAFNDHLPIGMRFSPDGTRIAYIDMPSSTSTATYRLVTVSADGTGPKRVIRTNAQLGFTPPFWIDNGTVGWVESGGPGGDVYKAPDANGAGEPASTTRSTLLHCDTSVAGDLFTINQVAQGPFGLIVAGSTGQRGGVFTQLWSAMSLYRMTPGDCSTTDSGTQLLEGEPYGGEAWDFSLSPDGLTILYSSTHGAGLPDGGQPPAPQHDLYVVPSDGSSAPMRLAGDPLLDDIEPRWVAGGRQILWTQAAFLGDADATSMGGTLMIANADGTHVRSFRPTLGGLQAGVIDTGMNRAFECNGVPGSVHGGAAAMVLLLGLLLFGINRRRRRE